MVVEIYWLWGYKNAGCEVIQVLLFFEVKDMLLMG